ncbi:MAG: glycoside hydrolase family 88 protein [Sedimentisphaerales bacterium]|nr:glycoside hydrolase family 88 protein [Sedimentisphaerales bacterium]
MSNRDNDVSRRAFLAAGGMSLAGMASAAGSSISDFSGERAMQVKNTGVGSASVPVDLGDKIERAKIALLGMQRYNWEQGVTAQAMLEMGEVEWTISLARAAVMRQERGRFSVIGGTNPITDCASAGEAVLYAGKLTGDPLFKEAADRMLEVILTTDHKNADGTLYHTQEPSRQIWSDAAYMLSPFLAAAGHYKEAVQQLDGQREVLWNEKDRLYSHMWDDEKKEFKRKAYWGFGNGWTAAALARVIKMLPENMSAERERLIRHVRELIDGCLVHLRDDGFFHDVVNDPNSFVETNLSQAISYTIYRGVAAGWLQESYLKPAEKMRQAAHSRIDRYGLIQDVCGLPHFDHPYLAPEGQAFFLLMETAYRDLKAK